MATAFHRDPVDSPMYAEALRQQETEAMRQFDLRLNLWTFRTVVVRNIAGLYTHPADPNELNQLATQIVQDPAVVRELLTQLEDNLHPKPAPPTPAPQPDASAQRALSAHAPQSVARVASPTDKQHTPGMMAQAIPTEQVSLETVLASAREQVDIGGRMMVPYLSVQTTNEWAVARRQFILPWLYALRIFTEANVSEVKWEDCPVATAFHGDPVDSPMYAEALRQRERDAEARRQYDLRFDLWTYRMNVVRNIAGLYTHPADPNELNQLATQIVQDPAVVKELLTQLEDKLHPKPAPPTPTPQPDTSAQTPPTQ